MLHCHSKQVANVGDFPYDFQLCAFHAGNDDFILATCECMLYCHSSQVANVEDLAYEFQLYALHVVNNDDVWARPIRVCLLHCVRRTSRTVSFGTGSVRAKMTGLALYARSCFSTCSVQTMTTGLALYARSCWIAVARWQIVKDHFVLYGQVCHFNFAALALPPSAGLSNLGKTSSGWIIFL